MRDFWRNLAWFVAIVGAIIGLLYLLVFDTMEITGEDPMFTVSIEPNLEPGDRILIRRGQQPIIGQLARCKNPQSPTKWTIGRVYGLAGHTVQMQGFLVMVDGQVMKTARGCPGMTITHPATGEVMQLFCNETDAPAWSFRTLRGSENSAAYGGDLTATVEPGKAFLISDDRQLHQDSRDYGQVDVSTCEHIVYRLWGKSYLDSSRRNTILY